MLNYQRVDDIGNYPKAVPLKEPKGIKLRFSNYGSATTAQQLRLSNHGSATTAQQPRLSNHGSATTAQQPN